jgi:hypothetical protein
MNCVYHIDFDTGIFIPANSFASRLSFQPFENRMLNGLQNVFLADASDGHSAQSMVRKFNLAFSQERNGNEFARFPSGATWAGCHWLLLGVSATYLINHITRLVKKKSLPERLR